MRARLSPDPSTTTLAFARALVTASALALGACGGSRDTAAVGLEHSTAAPHRPVKRPAAHTQRLFVTGASERLVGPFVARGDGTHIVTWVDSGNEGTRRLRALAIDDGGVPIEDTHDLVPSAGDVTSLVAKRAGGDGASFVVAWTSLREGAEALSVMGVGDDAGTRAAPVEVARSNDDIVWVEIVPVARGALLLWAEETRDGNANVLSVALDARGATRSVPSFVARGVVGWRVVPTNDGAALGLLADTPRKKDATGYALSLVRLDDAGRPAGQTPEPVVPDAVVQPDFDMARVGARGVLFAWTDKSGIESEVKTAYVDDRDRATPPHGLASSLSGAKLVSLTALAKGALLAWEEPTQRPRAARRVHLERVTPSGESSASTVLEIAGKGAPEIAPFGEGASVLGRMRVCEKGESDDACNAAPFVPAALALDDALLPVRAERIEQGEPAETVALAWGLGCARTCLMLGLGAPDRDNKNGQAVVAAPAFARATAQRVVVSPLYAPGRPRPKSLATIFRSDPVSQVALGRSGDVSLVAVLTRGEAEGPRRRGSSTAAGAGKGAALYLVPVDKDGKAGDAVPVATRASPAGGASFATAPDGSLALAWISREDTGDRVHLTRVSPTGKRLGDVLVTTRKGDVSEANVAAVDGGFVVGWIDGRDRNGEVYAAKVAADLGRVSEHQRITTAPGDASDLTIVAHPSGVVWLAWTDPRESPREGTGDIYAAAVRAKDAHKALDDTRVLATAAHSRSPSLALAQSGVAIAWIEEAPIGTDTEGHAAYGAMLGWLDARGHAPRDPVRLQGANRGAPVGIVLDPERGGARGLLVRSAPEELALDAFTVEPGGRVVSSWLISPEGPPTLDLPLALGRDVAIYAEESRGAAEQRVRRMALGWP